MTLTEYQRKRDFAKTPEPKGKPRAKKAAGPPRFVVQRHHATRLHWDVRLEMDGVLPSWAVPQGPPLEGGKRRLAVRTEDHPLEYLTFEGVIPDGYGAGTMRIWDTGTYELVEQKPAGGKRAPSGALGGTKELKLVFHGQKLRGSYVLVRTAQNEGRDWLLIKHETAPSAHPLESRIAPMLASLSKGPFDSREWAFEPKWDGVRTIAFVDGGDVRLQSRNLRDVTAQYPEVETAMAQALVGAYQAVVDGEIVALDPEGRPSFQLLQPRMHQTDPGRIRALRRTTPVFYYVFDLLWVDGEDLTTKSLRERKRRLGEAVQPMGAVRLSEHVAGDGVALYEAAKEKGLEGIVAKRLDAPYVQGRTSLWLKVKAKRGVDCVIGGWTEGQGGRTKALGAVLLGVYEDGERLRYIGHAGTGFDERTMRDLLEALREREVKDPPFALVPPKTNAPAHWARPELVCTVEFTEWTAEGVLRHPSYKGLRADVDPKECRGAERETDPGAAERRAEEELRERPRQGVVGQKLVPAVLNIEGRELRLSNLEKVLFPEHGYTKADLIRYYIDVSPFVLPYLRDRPLTLKLFPDGIHAAHFYQKDKPDFTPAWVRTWRHPGEQNEYILCNDLATLVWLANYTAIEMHPTLSRVDDPEHPDFVMIDVDPQTGATWPQVKRVAQAVKAILDARKLVGFPKTTGSRGIHVLVPIARRYTFKEVREFVEGIAETVHRELPNLTTREWQKSKRGPKVMIDYLQNASGKTTAGPYSARPLPGGPISTPFRWEELEELRSSDQFAFANIRARLAAVGDLLAPAHGLAQKLT